MGIPELALSAYIESMKFATAFIEGMTPDQKNEFYTRWLADTKPWHDMMLALQKIGQ